MHRNTKDITGLRFGKVLVVDYGDTKNGHAFWKVVCDCGNIKLMDGAELRKGKIKSCGCIRRDCLRFGPQKNKTHGLSNSRTYRIWAHMIQRCENPNNDRFFQYGGRGIKVCKEWHTFDNFLKDMGTVPQGKSIDRIHNDGNYETTNCRWATPFEQQNNMRNNVRLLFDKKILSLSIISKIIGIKKGTIYARLYRGWSIDRLFNQPLPPGR